jgi:tRNA (guanine-N7-)-methyltransferase
MAQRADMLPDHGFIGAEPFVNGVAQALVHLSGGHPDAPGGAHPPLPNVRLHHGDALQVLSRVPDGALSFLYLLHPDPWPKARHGKRRMMNDGPLQLIAAKLKPGGEFRFGTDHPIYLRHALMVMRRHADAFEWLVEGPASWQRRPGGWPETRYEAKARKLGHEVWYFRYRRR